MELEPVLPAELFVLLERAKLENPAAEAPAGDGWRIEVTHSGTRYIHRRGWGQNRESAKGGNFEELAPERKAAYYGNSQKRKAARTRQAKAG